MKKNRLLAALLLGTIVFFSNSVEAQQIINQDISNSTIENQTYNGSGGAVLVEINNNVTISNSIIQNNSAAVHGGSVYNNGTVTIADGNDSSYTIFNGNSSHAGGAISSLNGSTLNIGNYTSFEDNKTFDTNGDAGGALYVSDSTLNIGNNVSFIDNSAMSLQDSNTGAKGAAGGIYSYNSDVTIGDSVSFDGNESQYAAGGLYLWNNDGSNAEIGDNASFTDNSSEQAYGGAIGNFDGKLSIGEKATFSGNNAGTNGGAIANMNFSTTNGANVTIGAGAKFENNTAGNNGGAIYNDSSLTLNGAIFSGNSAQQGGALYNTENGNSSLANVIFNAGNGSIKNDIYNAGSIITSENNTFASDITNTGTINFGGTNTITSSISGSGSIINNGNIINNGSISTEILNNYSQITGFGSIKIQGGGTNSGTIEQSIITINANDYTNNGTIITTETLNNDSDISGTGNLFIKNGHNNGIITQDALELDGSLENNKEITVSEFTNNESATLTNNGTFTVNTSMTNIGTIINKGNFDYGSGSVMENIGTFINSGEDAKMNATEIVNNNVFGAIDGASLNLTNIDNDNGTLLISNNSSISISNQKEALGGILNVEKGINYLDINGNSSDFVGTLNIGNSNNDISSLYFQNGNITENATLNIEKGGELYAFDSANINLNQGDIIKGDIFISDTAGDITLNNYSLATGENSTKEGGEEAFYTQLGGRLNLTNNSSLAMKNLSSIQGGDINIDSTSKFIALTEDYGGIYSLNNLNTSGLFSAMNNDIDEYNIKNLNIGTNILGSQDNQADFTIDVYGRSNAENEHATDQFIGENLTGNGTVNISDWNLGGDIFGWDAPIDRDITLDNIFKYDNIAPTINLTATKKEVFTPIGWYQLNNHGGITGNYTLNLTRFNPQVYRGQVTTLAQYMNQLAVNDMLFNHSMLLPSFKDEDLGYTGTMANRYAATNPVFAPYQYSRKDGGLWYRMYGTFETLQMSQGLSNVGNNAYGTIIGADFGLKELKNGWKFMPTAYIGYNGAHQYFAGMGAYQNGGQAGFLGTWYKNNFIIGGLIYGGVYQNSMDIAGHTDNTFNYFAGAATKAAYNWRFHRDWVLQPNLLLSYNFFGQQNWHSDFGQMGMMSGTLNGINLAPGLNLIWEKETFSIYATLQYMYNLNGAVDGRAGNVSLPHLYMDRGYIQYGFGVTKRFTDRCAGYFQTVFRNVGRTGVGFQLGFNILLGK